MAHLFSCTILISIKISPWMFQAWGVSSRKTLKNNTEHGTIQRFHNRCNQDILLGSTHSTVQHQLISRCACTVDTKETHRCWPVHHMGLSSISHVTLITHDENGITDILHRMSNNNDPKIAWIYWKLKPIMWQKWGQLYKFRVFTFIKRRILGQYLPTTDLRRPRCTEVEPDKYDENDITDLKVEEHVTDRSRAKNTPVLKGEHLLLRSPTYAKPQNAKPSRNVELAIQVKMTSTPPTPKQVTLFHSTSITIRWVTTGLVIGHTHTYIHTISTDLLHCTYLVNFSCLWLNSATMINSSRRWTMTIFIELKFSMDTTVSLWPNISMEGTDISMMKTAANAAIINCSKLQMTNTDIT